MDFIAIRAIDRFGAEVFKCILSSREDTTMKTLLSAILCAAFLGTSPLCNAAPEPASAKATAQEKEEIAAGLVTIVLAASNCGWKAKTREKAMNFIAAAEAELKRPAAPMTHQEFLTLVEYIGPRIEQKIKDDPAYKARVCATALEGIL